jgi:hypothetical protein
MVDELAPQVSEVGQALRLGGPRLSAPEKIGSDWLLRLLLISRGLRAFGAEGALTPSA